MVLTLVAWMALHKRLSGPWISSLKLGSKFYLMYMLSGEARMVLTTQEDKLDWLGLMKTTLSTGKSRQVNGWVNRMEQVTTLLTLIILFFKL